jgi:hypothetical protein
MSRTLITHVEVVLLTWQHLPEELLRLSAEWMFLEGRFYRIAQVDVMDALTLELLEFFERLKEEHRITDFCSRMIVAGQTDEIETIKSGQTKYSELPDWVRP